MAPLSQIVLLGYSWSGVFASIYAGSHPARLHALILLDPAGFGRRVSNPRALLEHGAIRYPVGRECDR